MKDFLKYFAPLITDIERGYRSLVIIKTIDDAISQDEVRQNINKKQWFWGNTVFAHRCNLIMCLGKIFDNTSKTQSIHMLKRWIRNNSEELSEKNIFKRKGIISVDINYGKFRKPYFHQFEANDFRRFDKRANELYSFYNKKIKDWRNKVFAHREHSEESEYKIENIQFSELEYLYSGIYGLYQDAFNAFYNGMKFTLKPITYSEENMVRLQTTQILNFR